VIPDPSIPGQTPLDDLSGLRIRGIRTTAELNAAEAENIRKATLKYLAARPTARVARFDVRWLRRRETNIGVPPHEIEVRLHELLADLRAWQDSGMMMLEQAVRLHHVAVRIHPFPNGNGRWSRMVANIWLRLRGEGVIEWPETTIGTRSTVREEYLAAVRAADAGDYSGLVRLHERFWRRE
jgi:hypothetical protein